MSNSSEFYIYDLFKKVLSGGNIPIDDQRRVFAALEKEIKERPFKVAVIGQAGVGKSTTLNSVFGLDHYTSSVSEGTTDIIEEVFEIKEGFKLAVYDMPGLNVSVKKDLIYEEKYKEILPGCDVVIYIINAHSRDIGEDCRILKNVVIPICKDNNILRNLVIAVNKIDTVGEPQNEEPYPVELQWDEEENRPTPQLAALIEEKLHIINVALVKAHIIDNSENVNKDQFVIYSAMYNFNLRDFFMAILNTERGWIWATTVGIENIGKWSDKRLNLS